MANGVKYMFEPPAGQGASDDDLIVFLVNYVFAVSRLPPSPSTSLSTLRVMIGGRSAPSGEDEPHTHRYTHTLLLSFSSPSSLLAVLLNVSIIFRHFVTCGLSRSCLLSFSVLCL